MHLDCLKQNCYNCGDSYDDSQKEIVPNSQTNDATPDGSGTDFGVNCCAKKFDEPPLRNGGVALELAFRVAGRQSL